MDVGEIVAALMHGNLLLPVVERARDVGGPPAMLPSKNRWNNCMSKGNSCISRRQVTGPTVVCVRVSPVSSSGDSGVSMGTDSASTLR